MNIRNNSFGTISFLRWLARIWSGILLAFAVVRIVTPDPTITEPVPLEDWFLLSLWLLPIMSLVLAWRWEKAGAISAVVLLFVREMAWLVLKGAWIINFLIVWAVIIPPAALYLLADHKKQAAPV